MSSAPSRSISLIKAHAYGNDFLLAMGLDPAVAGDEALLARRACDRHRGIGADGLMFVDETASGARMRLRNADGSPSELSGNGVRCVAAWLSWSRGLNDGADVVIDTEAGPKRLTLTRSEGPRLTFRADMGVPEEVRQVPLEVEGEPITAVTMRVGNPQCVVLGPATEARLHTIAARLAVHPHFPQGTNVELAEVLARDRVRILIWERGVGPTSSSGTGTCAAAVAAAAYGGADRYVEVTSPGGSQTVEWTDRSLSLTGWAEVVGRIEWWM